MPRVFLIIIIFVTTVPTSIKGQGTLQLENYTFETHAYNIGINAVLGGIGSIINKNENEKWSKAFVRGFGFGAVGGYIKLKGKALNQLIYQRNTPEFAWLSKAVYFAGNSIVENAATNQPIFSNWHFMLGFMRFDLNLQNSKQFKARLMPVALMGTVYTVAKTESFDVNLSLRTGTPVFFTENRDVGALSIPGAVLISESRKYEYEFDLYRLIAHEEVHQRQGFDFIAINTIVNNPLRKMKWYKGSEKYIYWDYNQLGDGIMYQIMNQNDFGTRCKFNNYLEAEAEWFATRRLVQCK